MTRLLLAAALLPLAACSTVPAAEAQAPAAEPQLAGAGECSSDGLARFVGQVATDQLREEMRRVSGAKVLRPVPPGSMVTMDYRTDRLTVKLDEANRVLSASCG